MRTDRAVDRHLVPVAASVAVAGVLEGPPVQAVLLARFPQACYLAAGDRVVALVEPVGLHLPNALVLPAPLPETSGRAVVGGGRVRIGGVELRVGRWWDPMPHLGRVDHTVVAARLAGLDRMLPPWPSPQLDAAPTLAEGRDQLAHDLTAPEAAVSALIGLGPGLTPAGDDLLAGTAAGLILFGAALSNAAAVTAGRRMGAAAAAAGTRTTLLSADLLRHAATGAVAAPAARVCRALAGRGDLAHAVAGLLAMGHTSGSDLAQGLRLGINGALGVVGALGAGVGEGGRGALSIGGGRERC